MRRAARSLGGEASGEAEIAPQFARGPPMGRTAVLGHGLSVYWATLELGEDLDIAEELEALHGIRV